MKDKITTKVLTRDDKIKKILKMHMEIAGGVVIQSDFTIGKYDFLLEEGFVMCPPEKRDYYMNLAKAEYKYELQNIINTSPSIAEVKAANLFSVNMGNNTFSFQQTKYLCDKIKIISLKDFMSNEKEITFAPNGYEIGNPDTTV